VACELALHYREANTIHLVIDNLNIHRRKSLTDAFGIELGTGIWERFTVHYTPKHGSWLNQAEIEIGLFARQCLGNRRIPDLKRLRCESRAWKPPYEPRPNQDQLAIQPPGSPPEVWLQIQIFHAVTELELAVMPAGNWRIDALQLIVIGSPCGRCWQVLGHL